MQYVFTKYVDDKCKVDENYRRKVKNKETIYVDIKNVLYVFNSDTNAVIFIQELSSLRNALSHDYNSPDVMHRLHMSWAKEDGMRAVCNCLGISIPNKSEVTDKLVLDPARHMVGD